MSGGRLRVAILGAGGTIAPAIVRDLGESEEVSSMLLLDRDEDRLREVAASHTVTGDRGAADVEVRVVDASRGLAAALVETDVLVNSASYRLNLHAMRACLEAGCHYLDLGGLYWMTGDQLELGPQFEAAGLLGVLGIGSAPGKTNLMAAVAARELGDGVEEIHVAAAGRDLDPPPGLSFPYAVQTLVDEVTMPPVVLRDGRPHEIPPLSEGGAVDFGAPIGEAETIYTLHSEIRTFGESFGCPEASFRLSLAPALLERLTELARAGADRAAPGREAEDIAGRGGEVERVARTAARPSSQTVSVHVVDAVGGGRAVRTRCVTEPKEAWGIGGGVVSTATPAAATVRLLARGEVEARGVLPPERCLSPEAVFAELERHGVTLQVGDREEVAA